MKIKSFLGILAILFILTSCKTQQTSITTDLTKMQGGMWIPSELKGKNEAEIKALGGNLTAEKIYNTELPSIKDAIVHFDGGCTAEVISDKGLILTNHHCGYDAIQSHSTVDHDYLTDGFWAENFAQELPNKGMTVTFIVSMDNVTDKVFANTANLQGTDLDNMIKKNITQLKNETKIEPWQSVQIKSFSNGNEYYNIISEEFKDIRLVGAPPSSIGKFGADTDNWMWPRHSGDFSIFRIYADANNIPAEYNENNVPYKPKHSLPVSLDGVETGDFTMVFGFPGRTDEYLPAVAIDQIVNDLNPNKIAIREASLAIMDKYMRQNPKIKIQYASKYAGIANSWKKWIGESQGLKKSDAVANKKALEADFQKIVDQKGLTQYKEILPEFDKHYAEYGDIAQSRDYFVEIFLRNVDLMNLTFQLYQLEQVNEKQGKDAFKSQIEQNLGAISSFYKDFDANVDRELFAKLFYMYDAKYAQTKLSEEVRMKSWQIKADEIYSKSNLLTIEGLKNILESKDKNSIEILNQDVAYQFAKPYISKFINEINPNFSKIRSKIDPVQKDYTKALMEVFPNMRYFADANSTLRVTYGQVKGYAPRDGVEYEPKTYLDGVIEKYVPGDYEFDVSSRIIDLYKNKDFGIYAEKGKLPVNFIGTNHTTGGNSGSPVLDANGNLIGLNFDRVWEGTMSDYNYDANICRNVMVDVRYILFVIDKFAGAKRLIQEMKLVNPKK
jgi:hypothetical protein